MLLFHYNILILSLDSSFTYNLSPYDGINSIQTMI